MDYSWYDFVGNIGVALILVAYLALQLDKMDAKGLSYSLCNAIGAAFILISLHYAFNLSAFVIEIAWFLISMFGIFLAVRRKRS